jgi:hypothetical protein
VTVRAFVLVAATGAVLLGGCSSSDPGQSAQSSSTTAPPGTSKSAAPTAGPAAPAESAGDAVRRQFQKLSDGQFVKAYEEIHPEQQRLFSAAQYACVNEQGPSAEVTAVEIIEEYAERHLIPGTAVEVDATAVTARVTVSTALGETTDTDTYYEVALGDRWVFTVSNPQPIIACTP